jgi:Fe-S-cluster containining protein
LQKPGLRGLACFLPGDNAAKMQLVDSEKTMVLRNSPLPAHGGKPTFDAPSAQGAIALSGGFLPPGPTAFLELEKLYREVEREVLSLGVGCWARGDCCDFSRFDHKLMASSLEIAYVKEKHPGRLDAGSSLCPFWKAGKCTERERRPLGCRTFFCDRRYRGILEDLHAKYYLRLRQIARSHPCPWGYEPFVDAVCRPEGPCVGSGLPGQGGGR